MQRKFISREVLEKYNITSEDEVVYIDSSPTPDITLPPRTVAIAIQGNYRMGGYQGTVHIMRHDSNDTVLLNNDAYAFNGNPTEEKIEVIGPIKESEYHHGDDIRHSLKLKAPKSVIDRLEEIRLGNLTDSNFL